MLLSTAVLLKFKVFTTPRTREFISKFKPFDVINRHYSRVSEYSSKGLLLLDNKERKLSSIQRNERSNVRNDCIFWLERSFQRPYCEKFMQPAISND